MRKKLLFVSVCLMMWHMGTFAQMRSVTGTVVSEDDGQPMVGVSVVCKGSKTGAVTDMDGKFTLNNLKPEDKYITVSFIGMESQTVAIKPGMKIVLKSNARQIQEVVVTGMQQMDRRLFTGAASSLSADDAKIDGLPDISRSLEGKVAGVSVQNVTGTFGTAPKIRVRGATSIYGDSKPLWVVDGVIMDDVTNVSTDQLSSGDANTLISSAIAGLNADDIESFQILKDGSATSIYGARAMAGVIVVTTKKGRAGRSHISYTGEYTIRQIPSYNDFNIMDSQEQMGIYRELQQKGWLNFSSRYNASESGVYGKMFQLINTYNPTTGTFALENTAAARAAYLQQAEYRNTDWFKKLFSNALQQNHSVSISAGTEKAQFYASISAMLDPGWYKSSEVNRYTANLNGTYRVARWLTLNMITMASYRKQKAPGTIGQTVDAVYGKVRRDFDINPYSYSLNTSRTLDPDEFYTRNYAPFNILHELDNNQISLDVVDLKYQAELKFKPVSELEISALGAVKYSGTSQAHMTKDDSNQAQAYRAMGTSTIRNNNPWLYTDPDQPYDLPISILPNGGIYQKTTYRMLAYDFRGTFNWNHHWNQDNYTNLFGGMELNSIDRTNDNFYGWGMQYALGETPFYTYQYFKKGIEGGSNYYSLENTRTRMIAFFANATYSFKGKYVLNGTIRYEGSNRLGMSHSARWLPTWNISGAWNVHEESFCRKLEPTLSHLTFRASYSLTADSGPDWVSNSTVIIKSAKPYRPFTSNQETGLGISDLANDELTYEKKHELNLGFSVGFLNNRINLDFDWYKRNNYDLIGPINTGGVGGIITKYANVADMESSGEEFTLSTKNIVTKVFSWETNFIFSHATTKITNLDSQSTVMDLVSNVGYARQGYPVRALFSVPFVGLDRNGVPILRNQDGDETTDGSSFDLYNSDNVDYLKYEGPTDPTITGSLGNVFSYKGFRLNVFMTYAFGNVVRLNPVFSANGYTDLTATPREFKNRWTVPGDENVTNVPTILSYPLYYQNQSGYQKIYNIYNYTDVRVAKGDFIRMKEISLSYEFNGKWMKRLGLTNLSLKVQGTNLFLLYADKKLNGQDPEFFMSGGVSAPVPKQYTITLRVGL